MLMRNPGRFAGLIYLLLVVLAPVRLIYVPSKIIVPGDATATANNIAANQTLFRVGIASELLCGVIVLFLTFALYRLFREIDANVAAIMVITGGIMPATIDFLIGMTDAGALMLVRGADYLSVFDAPQRHALAMLFLRLHHHVVVGAETLWGIWLFPLALLTWRSGFMPRFIAIWLAVNGCAYIVMSASGLLFPRYESLISNVAFPALLGEIAFMLWLVIKGATPQRRATAAPAR